VVIVVVGVVAAAITIAYCVVRRRDRVEESGHDGRFRTSLEWGPGKDPKGMVRRFPLETDAAGRVLPLLLAAFDKRYLMNVILPRAVEAVGRKLKEGLRGKDDDGTLRRNAIHLYTRPEIYEEANRLMRLDPDHNEPEAPLWPFLAILQMALVREMKDATGETLYRGGLMSAAELDHARNALAAGGEGEILLRGVTSCSRSEQVAVKFARGTKPSEPPATPPPGMVRVIYSVSLRRVTYSDVVVRHPGLPYGPAVPIKYVAEWHKEEEVVLLDGTVLKVAREGDITEGGPGYDFECVQIKARVDWEELDDYFALCEQAMVD
jgi:hypothetical protein